MKKLTSAINTFSETILSIFLIAIIVVSFLATNNLGSFNVKETQKKVMGINTYDKVFNPNYVDSNTIKISDAGLEVGTNSMNVVINSTSNEESEKFLTLYNKYNFKMKINIVYDIYQLDENANYYIIVNDDEKLVKDGYKIEQYNYILELEPSQSAVVAFRVKSLKAVDTGFNVIFSELPKN